jgi:hypothetical protein
VSRVRNRLPEDAEEPQVAKFDVSAETIMWVAVFSASRNIFEISDLAEKFIKPRLQTLPGVGSVRTGGSNEQAMRIEIDRKLLANYALTVTDVVTALRAQNVEVPSGRVEGKWREFVVKTQGEFNTPEGFATIVLAYRNDTPVRLGDVASIRYGFENERTTANYTGRTTTGLGIVKQSRANTLEVAAAVRAAWPKDRALGARIPGYDWVPGDGLEVEDAIAFAAELKSLGFDFVDVSSGGVSPRQQIKTGPGYQVRFAAAVKAAVGLPTICVGMIFDAHQANAIVADGKADAVMMARALLNDPLWAWRAADALDGDVAIPNPYLRGRRVGVDVPRELRPEDVRRRAGVS